MSVTAPLLPASFRGVPFYVENAGGNYGRRFADHEYPARDTPFAEDLGRSQRVWPITGYTIGPGFRLHRMALVAACERKGAGELVHPLIGIVQAVCRTVSFTEERSVGMRSMITMEFAEPGQLQEPTGSPNSEMQIEAAADQLGGASGSAFTGV
jgi:prophage DNA circulation protein